MVQFASKLGIFKKHQIETVLVQANGVALVAGTAAVQGALNKLNDLAQILNTVDSLIAIVAKIVPMVLAGI
jgi:hypothetical protein